MSTLYIRLPPRVTADHAPQGLALVCPFARVSHGAIEQEGFAPLSNLSATIAKAQRVVLLLAASDVAILRLKVPPLSPAKLKAALPNLVEDQLINDPAGCVVAAGGLSDGLRTVAVVQRTWLDLLAKTLFSLGARQVTALPAQLCLPCQPGQPGSVTAAINERGADIDMTLRLSEQDGIGLAMNVGQNETASHEAIRALCEMVPKAPIFLYVPQSAVRAYQEAVDKTSLLGARVSVLADNWPRWIAGANSTALDLMAGLGAGAVARLDWRAWRWPLGLAAAILVINITALNMDWWRMKSEANSLRASLIQIYRSSYPKESVIIDPLAQMRQKIAIAKRDAGLAAPDDFMAITAAFGEAWAGIASAAGKTAPAIAALEYREHSLFVRFKQGRIEGTGSEGLAQQVKTALAGHNLSLDLAPAQSAAVVWQIRSMK